jgi:hypothetical protein
MARPRPKRTREREPAKNRILRAARHYVEVSTTDQNDYEKLVAAAWEELEAAVKAEQALLKKVR